MFEHFFPIYFEWWHLPIIFLAGLIGESYGSVIGGGSIIIQSVQVFLGIPIQSAIATDNAAALGTEAGIISETYSKIVQHKKLIVWMTIPLILGGVVGTHFLLTIPTAIIKYLMIFIVLYLLFHSHFLTNNIKPQLLSSSKYVLLFIVLFCIGLYNNFIGIGEGTFSKIALMLILGLTFVEGHGLKTIAMVPIRIYSLIITTFAGLIVWPYLITLFFSNFIAGKYATKYIKKIPNTHMKSALTVLSLIFVVYLILFY